MVIQYEGDVLLYRATMTGIAVHIQFYRPSYWVVLYRSRKHKKQSSQLYVVTEKL